VSYDCWIFSFIKVVSKGFYKKKLLVAIAIVLLLLGVCVSVDCASDVIVSGNKTLNVPNGTIVVNDSDAVVVDSKLSVIHCKSKVYTVKHKYPTITMTGKPSCSCGKRYSYKWYTKTYINYCPYCKRYGTLYNAHKHQARFEKEITCRKCGSDWCIVCGKEKYSWSRRYLRKP